MDTNKLYSLLPDMATLVTVVELGSFTAAAERLGVTPSAVSRQVSRLESALSVKLLTRTTRKLALTESGKITFDACKLMVDSAQDAVQAASSAHKKPSGELRVATPKAFGTHVLETLLHPFLEKYPDISLKLKVTDHLIDPIRDEIDLIFRLTNHPEEGLVSRELGKVDLWLCATPGYLAEHGEPQHPQELTQHKCLYLGENHSDNQWQFTQGKQCITINVNGRYIVNHTGMRLNGVKQGLGIGVFPDFCARKAVNDGSVVRVLKHWQIAGNYQGVITLQFAQSKYLPAKMRVFIDYIIDCFKQYPHG